MRIPNLTIFCLLLIVSFSCRKTVQGPEGPKGDTGPAATSKASSLLGTVTIEKAVIESEIASTQIVTVTIENKAISAISNVNGKYRFDNLSAGIYDLKFTAADGSYKKIQQVAFPGNDPLYINTTLKLRAKRNASLTMSDSTANEQQIISIKGTLDTISNGHYAVLILAGNSETINVDDPKSYSATYVFGITGNSLYNVFYKSQLKQYFSAGATVYFNAYIVPNSNNAWYLDAYENKKVFGTHSSSNLFSFSTTL